MNKIGSKKRQANGSEPEADDEVIREVFSQKLYRPLVYPSKNVWRDSTQNKTLTSQFWIIDSLRYINEGRI